MRNKGILIEGRNMVHDALLSKARFYRLMIAESAMTDDKIKTIIGLAKNRGVKIETVTPKELSKLTEGNPQGVVAEVDMPEVPTLETILKSKRDPFILMLNHIDYEQNLGAILRSAWATGVDVVIASPNGVCQVTPVVAKVSMGAAVNVPLISMSLFQAADLLERYAIPIVGVEVEMGVPYTETKLTGGLALMMGGEATGLTEPLQKVCNSFVNIPMKGELASLNVSVASALVLFERLRQERVV